MKKICSKCKCEKDFSEFGNDKRRKDGKQSICYECYRIYDKERYVLDDKRKLYNKIQYKKNKDKISQHAKQYYLNHREKRLKYIKEYYSKPENKLKLKKYQQTDEYKNSKRKADKKYRENHKEYLNKYFRDKIKNDINYNLIMKLRKKVNKLLNTEYKSMPTLELLDCDIKTFKQWLGIIGNYYNGSKLHIDHIIPCALYDLSKESEQKKCFNYKNHRLIPAKDNLEKHTKLDIDLVKILNIEHLLPEAINA